MLNFCLVMISKIGFCLVLTYVGIVVADVSMIVKVQYPSQKQSVSRVESVEVDLSKWTRTSVDFLVRLNYLPVQHDICP